MPVVVIVSIPVTVAVVAAVITPAVVAVVPLTAIVTVIAVIAIAAVVTVVSVVVDVDPVISATVSVPIVVSAVAVAIRLGVFVKSARAHQNSSGLVALSGEQQRRSGAEREGGVLPASIIGHGGSRCGDDTSHNDSRQRPG